MPPGLNIAFDFSEHRLSYPPYESVAEVYSCRLWLRRGIKTIELSRLPANRALEGTPGSVMLLCGRRTGAPLSLNVPLQQYLALPVSSAMFVSKFRQGFLRGEPHRRAGVIRIQDVVAKWISRIRHGNRVS